MTTPIDTAAVSGSPCYCTALRKASRLVSLLYDEALEPIGMKTTQRAVLAQIRRSEPVSVGDLAAALVMDPGGLAHTLKPLVREGWVEIGIDPADRRNRSIRLTQAGHGKIREGDAAWAAAQKSFEAGFGEARAKALREAMAVLASDAFSGAFERALAATENKDARP